ATPAPDTADGNDRNLMRVTVCSESGMLARRGCPSTHREEYLAGDLPGRCTLHDGGSTRERKPDTKPAEGDKEPDPTPPVDQ
ncbi:MAG: hypothetical protein K0Q72_1207, partial [Armatimonadetes bacterium]|nr:hypothetical protein [Armatimonadota bacterium]